MTSSVLVLAALALAHQEPAATAPRRTDSIEVEVLHNVKSQPLGSGTVEDLDLPEEFLHRIADRIIRASYEEHYRIVVKDEKSPARRSGTSAIVIALLVFVMCAAGFVGVLLKRRGKGRAA